MSKPKIDFIGIGAQKSGTTWLYRSLNKISDVNLPYVKELDYFSRSPDYGKSFLNHKYAALRMFKPIRNYKIISHLLQIKSREELNWYRKWYFSDYTDKWYLSLFDKYEGIKGEITPNYALLKIEDIKRMKELAPNVKLIYMIRNPIDRCISHYFDVRRRKDKHFHERPFDSQDFFRFANSEVQEKRSDYLDTLHRYTQVFPEEKILIGFFDAIGDNPAGLLGEVLKFIGSESEIDPGILIKKKINASKKKEIPIASKEMLVEKYGKYIEKLDREIGGYCTKWHNDLNERETSQEDLFPTGTFSII